MAQRFTTLPGSPIAELAARHVLDTMGDRLPEALLLMPTRRACQLMRRALITALDGRTVLLPRILPLGDLEAELPALLTPQGLAELTAIPPAMPEWRRIGLLMRQVMAFERHRQGGLPFHVALNLARDLAGLQDRFARYGVPLTMEALASLTMPADYAEHWERARSFLAIVAAHWHDLEAEEGAILASTRQVRLTELLAEQWEREAPSFPVFAIGSTGSHPATARLLAAVAAAPQGTLIMPGLDPRIAPAEWEAIAPGHPLYHLKTLLVKLNAGLDGLGILGEQGAESIWLPAMAPSAQVDGWRTRALPSSEHIRIIPCAHGEEEARVLALLLREGVEQGKRTALITPDEELMQRVGAHLARFAITPDRLKQGTLATTQAGSLWRAIFAYLDDSSRTLPLLMLLRHPLWQRSWGGWLADAEPSFRGIVRHMPGQLPHMDSTLRQRAEYAQAQRVVRGLAGLERQRLLPSEWFANISPHLPPELGEGHEPVSEALENLHAADLLGPIDATAMASLLEEALDAAWRGGIHEGHPGVVMLTPVEARLECFDRTILCNMQDVLWPGLARPSAWLNLSQQQLLGLPTPDEEASLAAHDLLMLGSGGELFLTWPAREGGSPTTRSRYIERLIALLDVHGINPATLEAPHYRDWANQLDAGTDYAPATPPAPRPVATRRPKALATSSLDRLPTDPYWLYARYVLGLKELDPLDAEPDARDLGILIHAALKQLADHWTEHQRAATTEERAAIAEQALAPYSARPEARLFWQQRLDAALAYVNRMETERRARATHVAPEQEVKAAIPLGEAELTLLGRMDRLEISGQGARIGDYKTGTAPTAKDVLSGKKLQLLAYALALDIQGQPIDGLDYWELPGGRRGGNINPVDAETLNDEALLDRLHAMLSEFMDPATPLLARPISDNQSDRLKNPYDGISRYDEWAS